MKIEKIHIDSFMGKSDFTLEFTSGINIIRGDNESGKSTVAEFIKFMLYGASARGNAGEMPERARYLSFGENSFGGYMELKTSGGAYRIDRTVNATASGFRESLSVTDLDKKTQVFKGENAGEALLGIPEEVFVKAAYISQNGEGYTGGADLGNAIENLLFSADETVSTDKALKKLDMLRVSLLHKNAKGGMLVELKKEREALEERLAKALGENSDIIAKEGSLIDTERRIADNKAEYTQCKRLCELYDNYIAHTRFEKMDELNAELSETANRREVLEKTFDGFSPDGEYLGRLRTTAEQLHKAKEQCAAAETAKSVASKARAAAETAALSSGETQDVEAVAKRIVKRQKGAKALRIIGMICIVLAALGACAVYLMREDAVLYGAAAGTAVLGVLLMALAGVSSKNVRNTIETYGVSSVYSLLDKVREENDSKTRVKEALIKAREEESAAAALLMREQDTLEKLEEEFVAEAERLRGSANDAEALFSAVEKYISDSEELLGKHKLLSERLAQLRHETAAYDRESVEKMLSAVGDLTVFEKVDITEYSRKRDFCENAIAALEIKRSELEKSLAALHATVESPALIDATLGELRKKEAAMTAKYRAAELAMRSIENASDGLRTRVSPRLAEYAGKLLSVMTDGKYTEVGVDGEMAMTYLAKGGAYDVAYLSKGTREGAYFALRLALCDLVCKDEKLTLVLDESFAHTDDNRTKQCFRILAALAAEGTQSIVLTCHDREEKIAGSVSVANLIEI